MENLKEKLKAFFLTKKEIVKVNDKYAARYKKWWHLDWQYIGIVHTWSENEIFNTYVIVDTKSEAIEKLNNWFPNIEVLDTKYL